jgi:hypothetical protein
MQAIKATFRFAFHGDTSELSGLSTAGTGLSGDNCKPYIMYLQITQIIPIRMITYNVATKTENTV